MTMQDFHYRTLSLRDFSQPEPVKPQQAAALIEQVMLPEAPSFSEDQLLAAQKEAEAIGFAKGKAAAEAEIQQEAVAREQKLAETLDALTARMDKEVAALRGRLQAQQGEVANLIIMAVRKLTGHVLEQHPIAPIEPMLAECLAMLAGEEHVVVRVAPDISGALRNYLDAKPGAKGKFEVVEGVGLQPGDCRVEWADGNATRSHKAMWDEIERIITRHYAP